MAIAGYNDQQRDVEGVIGVDHEGVQAWIYINEAGKEVTCINLSVTELHVFILRCQAVERDLVAYLTARIAEREAK